MMNFIIYLLLNDIIFFNNAKCEDIFKDIIKLSLYEKYFVVLNNGLYLYNYNLLICANIISFDSSSILNSNDKIITTKLVDENNFYILCLINRLLYIFNEQTNKTISYQINNDDMSNDNYYNLLPYKIQNNILDIIIFVNKDDHRLYFY